MNTTPPRGPVRSICATAPRSLSVAASVAGHAHVASRIAVAGPGTPAWAPACDCEVLPYDADSRLGGHAHIGVAQSVLGHRPVVASARAVAVPR